MEKSPEVLLMNPIEEGQNYVVDIDPVISRHTGGKSKIGTFFPLGLTYIAAVLRENNIPVKILDPIPDGFDFKSALDYAKKFDVVIVPLAASNSEGVYRFFSYLKDSKRILMGTHATALAERILVQGFCDLIIRGEPEFTVLETIQNLKNLGNVLGVSYRENGRIFHNPDRPLIKDLDNLPFPARDLVDNSKYEIVSFPGKPTALVLTSRGCPFECTYCATNLFYRRNRSIRSPQNVVHEIKHVVDKYGIRNFFFADDTFNIGEKRVLKLCHLLQENNLDIQWACLCRVDTIDKPMLREMKKAGCVEILYGVESASSQVLAESKKNINLEQVKNAIKLTKEEGIRVSAFFMFGSPGDTLASIRKTSRLARKLNPNFASFNIVTPDPGTELYESFEKQIARETFEKFDRLNTDVSICDVQAHMLRRELVRAYLYFYGRPFYWLNLFRYILKDPLNAPAIFKIFFRQAKNVLMR